MMLPITQMGKRRCLMLDIEKSPIVTLCSAHPPRRRMEREYDLFEVLPDGTAVWREAVTGHENAIRKLHVLSVRTTNEIRVMHLETSTLIAVKNVREA
jgi:hypothetical protein